MECLDIGRCVAIVHRPDNQRLQIVFGIVFLLKLELAVLQLSDKCIAELAAIFPALFFFLPDTEVHFQMDQLGHNMNLRLM